MTRRSRGLLIAGVAALLVGAYALDVSTGDEVSSSLFYIVPVAFASWFLGRTPGMVAALVSAVEWVLAQRVASAPFSDIRVLYWNVAAEAIIYFTAALTIARARSDRERERRSAHQLSIAHEALDREMRAVGVLQRELLPQHPPEIAGYAWAVEYQTSTRAGGDYYDFLRLPDGRVGVFIGDATGHGAPAAVLMAMSRALLHSDPDSFAPPDRLLARLNQQLSRVLPEGWFLTACYAILDPESGTIEYSLAGHDAPFLAGGSPAPKQVEDCGGPPLGPFADARYDARSTMLAPGDTLVLFTDGVTEAVGDSMEMFGIERLAWALERGSDRGADQMLSELLAALWVHTAGRPLRDDATLLVLRRLGATRGPAAAYLDGQVASETAAPRPPREPECAALSPSP